MLRSVVAASVITACLVVPSRAWAQELTIPDGGPMLTLAAAPVSAVSSPALAQRDLSLYRPVVDEPSHSSKLLTSLYVTTAVMQALDVHSTYQALGRGAVEANPLVSGMTGHKAAFFAAKASVAAASIMAARRMAEHNKVAAILTMVGINSAYAMVVAHNYHVANSLR
ncbi:MAG TPA: DUF5658 family protein [Vicinamibacterales bacterium]|nr:DUF5658 family protein [Vicinamibacterales bacterium]